MLLSYPPNATMLNSSGPISIIIPAYKEQGYIGPTVRSIRQQGDSRNIREIIVVDGGSPDNTVAEAAAEGATVLVSPTKGRAAQMNWGAKHAAGSMLYFLHADSLLPAEFTRDILDASAAGFGAGCYRLQFHERHWFLRVNAWFTRFDINALRFGDQSLFVQKNIFERAGGFREDHIVMEDQEIIHRIRQHARFTIIPKVLTTSARKYTANGPYRMQAIFFVIYFMYQLGFSQQHLLRTFRRLITQDKM